MRLHMFYVYKYLREDESPYYIGKGKDDRAWHRSKHERIHLPKDKSRIVIVEENLSEEQAFQLEIELIKHYGRKDLSTGILHNLTNGGEGSAGAVFGRPSDERIQKIKDALTGRNLSDDTNYCVIKGYAVFNVQQTDLDIIPSETPDSPFNPIPSCEDRIIKTGAAISHGGDAAFYMPSQDRIQLPNKSAFNSEANYYATAFHELSHWTGAKHRLDRNLDNGRYGNPAYAFEELVAEISAAYLCADYKIQGELRHAGYIQSWLKACKDDSKAIFKAAALAQKAADYIQGLDATVESIAA